MCKIRLMFIGVAASAALAFFALEPRTSLAAPQNTERVTKKAVTSSPPISEYQRQLMLLQSVIQYIHYLYVDKPDDAKLIESAINGILGTLDPHSSYMNEESMRAMLTQMSGKFAGIGMKVAMENGFVKVVTPFDGSPAAMAGIRSGDLISHIDDNPVSDLTIEQAVGKMRGAEGSTVKLKVIREGRNNPFDVTITRAIIHRPTVQFRNEGDIGYIKLEEFGEKTATEMVKAINDISTKIPANTLKGYVLDLRNNPGGLLDQSIRVSDAFLRGGDIVSTRGRIDTETQPFRATSKMVDLIGGKPLIVLINGGSASASEIVAGALQDHKRATILGSRSFGKGSVQTIIPLGQGMGALRLTTARYYTPSGQTIQAKGITPDIEVLQIEPPELQGKTDTKGESSLKGHLKTEGEEAAGSQSYVPPDTANDAALNKALDLLRGTVAHPAFRPKKVK